MYLCNTSIIDVCFKISRVKESIMNNRQHLRNIRFLFLLIELVLYGTFLYVDIFEKGAFVASMYLKFASIILCFLMSLLLYGRKNVTKDIVLLRGALLFTVISDLYILILESYVFGLVTFSIVQLLYLIRLHEWRKQQGRHVVAWLLLLRNLVVALTITGILIILRISLDGLMLISILYFVSIFFNTVDAIRIQNREPKKQYQLYAIGMVLFLLCDINVGLFNLSDFILIEDVWFNKLYEFASIAMWMFYLPAQVLISLSGINRGNFSDIH